MNYSHRMASQFPVFLCEVHRTFPCPNVQQLLMLHHLSHCAPSKQFIPFCSYLFCWLNPYCAWIIPIVWGYKIWYGSVWKWGIHLMEVTDNPANLASLFRAFFRASNWAKFIIFQSLQKHQPLKTSSSAISPTSAPPGQEHLPHPFPARKAHSLGAHRRWSLGDRSHVESSGWLQNPAPPTGWLKHVETL